MGRKNKTYHHRPWSPVNQGERINYRLGFLYILTFVAFVVIAAKLFFLQVMNHSYYLDKAKKNAENRRELPARRGTISIAREGILAKDILNYSIALSAKRLRNRQKVIKELVSTLHLR